MNQIACKANAVKYVIGYKLDFLIDLGLKNTILLCVKVYNINHRFGELNLCVFLTCLSLTNWQNQQAKPTCFGLVNNVKPSCMRKKNPTNIVFNHYSKNIPKIARKIRCMVNYWGAENERVKEHMQITCWTKIRILKQTYNKHYVVMCFVIWLGKFEFMRMS